MQHNNAAQKRPCKKPASAPNTSQNTAKAQARAMILIRTLKLARSRRKDTMLHAGEKGARRKRTSSTSEARPARLQGQTLRPLQQNRRSSKSMLRRKWWGETLSSLPGLHETIPSGKDTGRPAQSSDLCRGKSMGHNPSLSHRDSSRNLHQARCERGTED